jgi:hypothetical protein
MMTLAVLALSVAFICMALWVVEMDNEGKWFATAIFCTVVGLLALFMHVEQDAHVLNARCKAQGGYMERGRGIELCIDEQTGRVIKLPPEVER